MGNLILCCIHVQLEHSRQIDLHLSFKRCTECGLVQYTNGASCNSCGCQIFSMDEQRSQRRTKKEKEREFLSENLPVRARETDEILENMHRLTSLKKNKKKSTSEEPKKTIVKEALESVQCPICLESISGALTLPCGHSLCESHVKELRGNCPICRKGFTTSVKRNEELEKNIKSVLSLVKATS
mmetsp:Transcript_10533/g.16174  ORF Transcript_10533/g.16174 Transcript_10533/m.16174 type:complete len:184 (+) Transcript_10533:82-633(+)